MQWVKGVWGSTCSQIAFIQSSLVLDHPLLPVPEIPGSVSSSAFLGFCGINQLGFHFCPLLAQELSLLRSVKILVTIPLLRSSFQHVVTVVSSLLILVDLL